ncbi:hypothetical protein ACT9SR_11565 [Enterococcus faecalis]|uniref:hypothetical protein n=1 Tax=Enterococcus faecalis TaxID=1351 RepID=UPI000A3308B0|nr:hypothetical protein [Enterococcus faecalis]OTP34994.1 hypothetical protein A5824_000549 [Enterococcus faecalis]HBI1694323.1 hypothetical protein [Enterococcus faecalis]
MKNFCDLFLNESQSTTEDFSKFESVVEFDEFCYEDILLIKSALDNVLSKRDNYTIKAHEVDNENYEVDLLEIIEKDDFDTFFFSDSKKNIIVELDITKYVKDECLSIYNFKVFDSSCSKLSKYQLIKTLNEYIFSKNCRHFETITDVNEQFFSSTLYSIGYKRKAIDNNILRDDVNSQFREVGQKLGYEDLNFIPEDFHNFERKTRNSRLNQIFKIYETFLSIIFISNKVIKIDDESFEIEFISEKKVKEKLNFHQLMNKRFSEAYKIYTWAYSAKTIDKIDIIKYFIYLESDEGIILNKDIFESIKFSYSQYLRENLSKFIDVQNKAIVAIEDNLKKFRDLRMSIGSILKTNSFTILAFFISNYILKEISNSQNKQLPIDLIKKSGYFICIIFLLYLILVMFQTFFEAKRVKKDYDDLKIILKKNIVSRYVDEYLPDKFIEGELIYLKNYSLVVCLIWCIEILLMLLYIYFNK